MFRSFNLPNLPPKPRVFSDITKLGGFDQLRNVSEYNVYRHSRECLEKKLVIPIFFHDSQKLLVLWVSFCG